MTRLIRVGIAAAAAVTAATFAARRLRRRQQPHRVGLPAPRGHRVRGEQPPRDPRDRDRDSEPGGEGSNADIGSWM